MKKILIINTLPIINFGKNKNNEKSAGNQTLYNTLKGLSENGFNVQMITFNDIEKIQVPFENVTIKKSRFYNFFMFLYLIKNNVIKKKTTVSMTTEIRRGKRTFLSKYWEFFGKIEISMLIRKFKPDLLYGYEIYSTKIAQSLGIKYNIPFVTRFQGTELGFFLDNEEKFYGAEDFVRGTNVDADLIIMANDGTDGDLVLNKFGIDENKIKFWVNGLHEKDKYLNMNKDKNYKEKLGISEDSFVICTANRFVDWKRIDRIIDCIKELTERKINVTFVAIGDGPLMEPLQQMVEEYKLDNVLFLGALSHDETIKHILNADLYITLNHSGNLGNSILEALALGTPVCTIKNHSVCKVLKDGYNAILLNGVDEVVEKIIELHNDKRKQKELSENERKFAKEKLLSWEERMKEESKALNNIKKDR